MKLKVYLETTIVSYLTARPTRDLIMTGMVEQTKLWWTKQRDRFELFAAEPVIREAARGDIGAAARRTELLRPLTILPVTNPAVELAASFISHLAMPASATDDALHIAIAAAHKLDFLLTWHCRHIANATIRPKLEALCLLAGLRCPIICIPPQLMGDSNEN